MFWMSWKAASISSSIFLFFSLAVSRSSETAAQCGGGTTVEAGIGFVKNRKCVRWVADRVADPDPGSWAFLSPESRIRNRFFRIQNPQIEDPGSQTYNFESLVAFFWAKSTIILCELAQFFFCTYSKINLFIILSFLWL
jgi:hypothetical protein